MHAEDSMATYTTIRFPSGRWGFAGQAIPAHLAYEHKTGRPATPEEIAVARAHGPRLAGLKLRSWATEEEALAAAEATDAR
jgi:hypothetical protein